MRMTIGIIEDDRLLNKALDIALKKEGYETLQAYTCKEARAVAADERTALLILDIGLPDGSGIGLFKDISKGRKVPAIFLTARDEEEDMLAAFDAGADDYVVKPFPMKVLIRRIEAVTRRSGGQERVLSCRGLRLHPGKKKVWVGEEEVHLTPKEYRLLEFMMENAGQVLTKDSVLEHVWDIDGQFVGENTVSVTVNRLRKKIEPKERQEKYIENVFGMGYRFGE